MLIETVVLCSYLNLSILQMKVNQSADSVVFFCLVAANISVFLHSSNKETASGIKTVYMLVPD